MKISVLIPTFNRREVLARTLGALFTQRFPADQYEVIVVDDGSTDETPALLMSLSPRCRFTFASQSNSGQAAARNAALTLASGDLVLFIDDDMIGEPDLVSAHVAAHEDGEEIVAVGRVIWEEVNEGSNLAAACLREEFETFYARLRLGSLDLPRDAWVPPNSSMPRNLAARIGGYDERLNRAREDTDFGLRLWISGTRTVWVEAARCRHVYLKSRRQLAVRDAEIFGRNDVFLARKHPRYRSSLPLSHVHSGSPARRLLRRSYANLFFSPEPLLRLPCGLANALWFLPSARVVAMRLLRTRRGIVWIRSALREAGSWKALQELAGEPLVARSWLFVRSGLQRKAPAPLPGTTPPPGNDEMHEPGSDRS